MWLKFIAVIIVTDYCVRCSSTTLEDPAEANSVTVGVILPDSVVTNKIVETAIENVERHIDNSSHSLSNINFRKVYWPRRLSPREVLHSLCRTFLAIRSTALIYLTVSQDFTLDIASAQYFLQLVDYLGIPVISWNAANPSFEKILPNSVILHMSPSTNHQVSAMISILMKYQWHTFAVVTTRMVGYNYFLQAIREEIALREDQFSFNLQMCVTIYNSNHTRDKLKALSDTDIRIILLYATREEATYIFKEAEKLKMTAKDFAWIVTQSVVGNAEISQPHKYLPTGILGIYFDTSDSRLRRAVEMAITVFLRGLYLHENDSSRVFGSLKSNLSCQTLDHNSTWSTGVRIANYLRNVSFTSTEINDITSNPETIEFLPDGTLKNVVLEVVNLNKRHLWKKVGWWYDNELTIRDVEWSNGSHVPPSGRPDKFHFRISFLEESPYLNIGPPDNVTKTCPYEGVECYMSPIYQHQTGSAKNESNITCCSGICVDLLKKLSKDLDFDFIMTRVEDGRWGSLENGTWNGLVKELLEDRADMVLTSFKVNEQRAGVVDFSTSFMETGIAVVVAKRTGIISPIAFLEPFDSITWFAILVVGIQLSALAIFLFEWLSPDGFDRKLQQPIGHNFSLFRTYWLVWALLFRASVNMVVPRGYTARFMSNMWASFTVVFNAIYTANLACFMITREEYYQLSGVEDARLIHPASQMPPLKFGTVPFGNTDSVLKRNFPYMHQYMRNFNKSNVQQGVDAVKKGELDAFIYDSSVLDYLVGKDDECRLLTVGTWYAMAGYAIAFPRNSRHLGMINDQLLKYQSSGHLEQWAKFWLAGACKPSKEAQANLVHLSYASLTLQQYMSAFLLLGGGIILAAFLLSLEKGYFACVRKPLSRGNRGCCTLVSLNLGKSLTFKEAVDEFRDVYLSHRCKNPTCDTLLWKARRELDLAKIKIKHLEQEMEYKSEKKALD